MPTLVILIAGFTWIIGVAILQINPGRATNRFFFLLSAVLSLWLTCVWLAMHAAVRVRAGAPPDELKYWLRANLVSAAWFPLCCWLLKESVVAGGVSLRRLLPRSIPWCAATAMMGWLPFADSYFSADWIEPVPSSADLLYRVIQLATCCVLLAESLVQHRRATGTRRVELRFLVLSLISVVVLIVALNLAGSVLGLRKLNRASPVLIFVGYCIAAWGLTMHRVFNPREIFVTLVHRAVVLGCAVVAVLALHTTLERRLEPPFDWLFSIATGGSAALWLGRRVGVWIDAAGERDLAVARSTLIDASRRESEPAKLASEFEIFLGSRYDGAKAFILTERADEYRGPNSSLEKKRPAFSFLCAVGWATPESLQRRRPTAAIDDMREYVAQHAFGVVVSAPRGSSTPSLVVALGVRPNEVPFTYPEVKQLQNLADLIDNILTHARVANDAALKAKAEHLAMMSRALAHDLKNLLTPVSSFLVHTDNRFPAGSDEAEVHSLARHSVRVMTDYVREALFFSERLEPKLEDVSIDRVLQAVEAVCVEHAKRRRVELRFTPSNLHPFRADRVLLQRLLVNLVDNAIDASPEGSAVNVHAALDPPGLVRLEVADHGCGIGPENINRVFEPYFTTKVFGQEMRGFGLGLAICEKIVQMHRGTITVRSALGAGTTFTIELPLEPNRQRLGPVRVTVPALPTPVRVA